MPFNFGQLVIGPPGSGKSTYCKEIASFLKEIGRKVAIINIDPANDILPYEAAVNIYDLITVEDVMSHKKLGPNGALIFCMEYLEENFVWLQKELIKLKDTYLIFDCPGQVELYTHHRSIKNLMSSLQTLNISLCAVYLLDSHYCSDAGKFISALLVTLSTMLHMELPHISVLSKVDMMLKFADKLPFPLEYYTEVLDLNYILESLQDEQFTNKHRKLNCALIELIEGYSLVSFVPLNIKDKRMLSNVKKAFDKANGYIYNAMEERNVQSLLACAVGAESDQERLGIDNDLYNFVDNNT